MTQDELWEQNYSNIMTFMMNEKKLPSKHRKEEHQMLNWMKYQRKRLSQGKFKPERIEKFLKLLEIAGLYLRKNQYAYASQEDAGNGFYDDLFKRTT